MDSRDQVLGLLGVLVVAYDEGARLGKVSNIYLDRKACRITGIAVSTGLPGFDNASHVDFKHVRILGKDVVIVASQKALTPLPEGIDRTSLKRLQNVRIATRDGTYVGRLLDVSVDVSNGNIAQLVLSERERLNIDVRNTAIGADIIVLPSDVRKKTKDVRKKTTKGAPTRPASASSADSVTNLFESATKRFIDAAKGTTEKVFEATKRTTDQAKQAMSAATDPTTPSPSKTAATTKRAAGSASQKSAARTTGRSASPRTPFAENLRKQRTQRKKAKSR